MPATLVVADGPITQEASILRGMIASSTVAAVTGESTQRKQSKKTETGVCHKVRLPEVSNFSGKDLHCDSSAYSFRLW